MDDKAIEETEYLMMLLHLPPQTPNVSIIQQSVSIEIVDDDGNMYVHIMLHVFMTDMCFTLFCSSGNWVCQFCVHCYRKQRVCHGMC